MWRFCDFKIRTGITLHNWVKKLPNLLGMMQWTYLPAVSFSTLEIFTEHTPRLVPKLDVGEFSSRYCIAPPTNITIKLYMLSADEKQPFSNPSRLKCRQILIELPLQICTFRCESSTTAKQPLVNYLYLLLLAVSN